LYQRQNKEAIAALQSLLNARVSVAPQTRLHALCTLDALNGIDNLRWLEGPLADTGAGVRRHAVRLCEDWLGGVHKDKVFRLLQRLELDPAFHVRMQLAYVLGRA